MDKVVGYVTIKVPIIDEGDTQYAYLSRAEVSADADLSWEDLAYDFASNEMFYDKVARGG